jgi:DNA-binding transcriptional regulator of glucitol operon
VDRTSLTIALVLAGAWLLQIVLSSLQMRRFHRTSQEWRRLGSAMAVGMAGTTYRRKTYAVVVIDEAARVVKAGKLSGFTIAADLKPVEAVEGMALDLIGRGAPPQGVNAKTWAALDHAAGFLRRKLAKEAADVDAGEIGGDT